MKLSLEPLVAFPNVALADTIAPPPRECSCCGEAISYAEWIANPTRRPWPGLSLEIEEHACKSTLAEELFADGARVAA